MSFNKEIFKNHTASYFTTSLPFANKGGRANAELLYWKAGPSRLFAINYICVGPNLFVSGDLGNAVYQWGAPITLEAISTNNLDYFAGKCQASPYGHGYEQWSHEYAKKSLHDLFNNITEKTDFIDEPSKIKKLFDDTRGWHNINFDWEWCAWCEKHAAKVFGDDWFEICSPKIGYTVSIECEMQLEGLKMAIQYLKAIKNSCVQDFVVKVD